MVLDFPQEGWNSNFFLNVTWVTGQSSLLILYFQGIVGYFFMKRSAAPSFKASLDTAWRVWFNLTETVGPAGPCIPFDDLKKHFYICAQAITSAVTALKPNSSINNTHRNTIDKILNGAKGEEGEKGASNLPSLRELLEKCEKALKIGEREESEQETWNAMAEAVREACKRLAETIGNSGGR
jgi:hypothetical protein